MPSSIVYTVSQANAYIKSLCSEDELLADIWLAGEISNFKQAASGHCYFTLKDAGASMRAVMWRTQAASVRLPREGDAVVAHGYISVYEARGDLQFYVDHLEAGGTGWLWQEFQRLKERLELEGLFDAARKRPLAARPARIGVVTSASGAALRDILRTLATRYPLVELILTPTAVQGDEAPAGLVAAIGMLNRYSIACEPLDAIIVARGGGSIEELWAFNDERVARAIAASGVPVITGVGHETDFTIADFVADLRAPTPTGAAIAAVPDLRSLSAEVAGLHGRARSAADNAVASTRSSVADLTRRLSRLSPEARLAGDRLRIDDLERRAALAIGHRLSTFRERLQGQQLLLSGLDPTGVLARGYALVTKDGGGIVTSAAQVALDDTIDVRVTDGTFDARVS